MSPDASISHGTTPSPVVGDASPDTGGSVYEEPRGEREAVGSPRGPHPRPYLRIGRLLMDLPIAQVRRHDVQERSTVRALAPRDAVRIYAEAPPDG